MRCVRECDGSKGRINENEYEVFCYLKNITEKVGAVIQLWI
jgi:hypothetical protein